MKSASIFERQFGQVRVCHLLKKLEDGGVQNLLLSMVQQDTTGIEYSIAYLQESETSIKEDFKAEGVQLLQLGRDNPFDPRIAVSLAETIKARGIDVIHAHLPWQHIIARLASLFVNVSVVSTHHNLGDNTHPVVIAGERITRPLDAVTVAVTNAVKNQYLGRWVRMDNRWRIIHNGIDVQQFHDKVQLQAQNADKQEGTTYLHIGRYIPSKAQTDLLCAMAKVVEQYPNSHLYLVGWGDLEETLRSTTKRLGLSNHVTITGYQNRIAEYYAKSDVFVSSSLSEGFPITYIEAMAAKLPILSTAFDGVDDIVANGKTGYIVPKRDIDALTEAMVNLQSQSLQQEMGQQGLDRARKQFDAERTEQQYIQLYRELCN